jgi:peptidoglycan/LPS O-acetylase OafA/YrhL
VQGLLAINFFVLRIEENGVPTLTPKTGYLPTLDGWRAIAIVAVLLDHTVGYSNLRQYARLVSFTHTGPNGVSLFFAISGFLICTRLLEEKRAFGQISLRGFYIRRACRILPPAMFYLLVIAVLSFCGLIIVSPGERWSSMLFFRNYLPENWISRGWGGYTIHHWSLAVEEHFYFLWPAALVFMGKRRARWFALLLAFAIAARRTWDFHRHWFDRLIPGLLFGGRTDVRMDALLLGCVAALILDDDAVRASFSQSFRPWMWWLCVGAYLAVQGVYFLQRTRSYSLFESALLPLVVAGTVYGPKTFITTLLESGVLKWIGRLSYSLYLWQQLFSVPAESSFSILQKPPLSTAMIFPCALLSYRFIERPLIRWGHHLAPPLTEGRDDLVNQHTKMLVGVNPSGCRV